MINYKVILLLLILILTVVILFKNKTENFSDTDSSYITKMYTKLQSESCNRGDDDITLPNKYKPFTKLCYNKKHNNQGVITEISESNIKNNSGYENLNKASNYVGCYSILSDNKNTKNYFDNYLDEYNSSKAKTDDSTYVLKTYNECLNENRENSNKPIGLLRKIVNQNSLEQLNKNKNKGYCIRNNKTSSGVEIGIENQDEVFLKKGGVKTKLNKIDDFYCNANKFQNNQNFNQYTGGLNSMAVYYPGNTNNTQNTTLKKEMIFYVYEDVSTRIIKFTLEKFNNFNENVIAFYGCDEDFTAPVQYDIATGKYIIKDILNVGMKSVYQDFEDIYLDKSKGSIPIINRFILKDYSNYNHNFVLNYNWLQFEGNYIMDDDKIKHYINDLTYTGSGSNQKIKLSPEKGNIDFAVNMCQKSGYDYFGTHYGNSTYYKSNITDETNIIFIDEIDSLSIDDLKPDCITMRGLADEVDNVSVLALKNQISSNTSRKIYYPYVGQYNPCFFGFWNPEKDKDIKIINNETQYVLRDKPPIVYSYPTIFPNMDHIFFQNLYLNNYKINSQELNSEKGKYNIFKVNKFNKDDRNKISTGPNYTNFKLDKDTYESIKNKYLDNNYELEPSYIKVCKKYENIPENLSDDELVRRYSTPYKINLWHQEKIFKIYELDIENLIKKKNDTFYKFPEPYRIGRKYYYINPNEYYIRALNEAKIAHSLRLGIKKECLKQKLKAEKFKVNGEVNIDDTFGSRNSKFCNLLAITKVMKPKDLQNFEGVKNKSVLLQEKNNLFLNSSHDLLKTVYFEVINNGSIALNLKYKCKRTAGNKKEKRGGIVGDPIITVSSNRTLKYFSEQKKYSQDAFDWCYIHNYKKPKYYTYPEKEDSKSYDGLLHIDTRKVVAVVFFLGENYAELEFSTIKLYDIEGNIMPGNSYEVRINNSAWSGREEGNLSKLETQNSYTHRLIDNIYTDDYMRFEGNNETKPLYYSRNDYLMFRLKTPTVISRIVVLGPQDSSYLMGVLTLGNCSLKIFYEGTDFPYRDNDKITIKVIEDGKVINKELLRDELSKYIVNNLDPPNNNRLRDIQWSNMNDLGNIADNFGIQSNIKINSEQMKEKNFWKTNFFEMNKKSESENYGENDYSNHIVDFWHTKFIQVRRSPTNENLENNLTIFISKLFNNAISEEDKKKVVLAVTYGNRTLHTSDLLPQNNFEIINRNKDFNIKLGNLFYNNTNLELKNFKIFKDKNIKSYLSNIIIKKNKENNKKLIEEHFKYYEDLYESLSPLESGDETQSAIIKSQYTRLKKLYNSFLEEGEGEEEKKQEELINKYLNNIQQNIKDYNDIYDALRIGEDSIITDELGISTDNYGDKGNIVKPKNRFIRAKTGLNDLFKVNETDLKKYKDSEIHGFINLKIIDNDLKLKYVVFNVNLNKIIFYTQDELISELKKKTKLYYKYQVFNIQNTNDEISNGDRIYFMIYSNNSKPFGFVNIGNNNSLMINKDTFLTKGVYAGKYSYNYYFFGRKTRTIELYYNVSIDNLFRIDQDKFIMEKETAKRNRYRYGILNFRNKISFLEYLEKTLQKVENNDGTAPTNIFDVSGSTFKFNYEKYANVLNGIESEMKVELGRENNTSIVKINSLSDTKVEYNKIFNLHSNSNNSSVSVMITLNNQEVENNYSSEDFLQERIDKNLIKNLSVSPIKNGTDENEIKQIIENMNMYKNNKEPYKNFFNYSNDSLLANYPSTQLPSVEQEEINANTEYKVNIDKYKENISKIMNNFEIIKYFETKYEEGNKKYMNLKIENSEGIIDIYNENETIKTVHETSKETK